MTSRFVCLKNIYYPSVSQNLQEVCAVVLVYMYVWFPTKYCTINDHCSLLDFWMKNLMKFNPKRINLFSVAKQTRQTFMLRGRYGNASSCQSLLRQVKWFETCLLTADQSKIMSKSPLLLHVVTSSRGSELRVKTFFNSLSSSLNVTLKSI